MHYFFPHGKNEVERKKLPVYSSHDDSNLKSIMQKRRTEYKNQNTKQCLFLSVIIIHALKGHVCEIFYSTNDHCSFPSV